MRIHKSLEFGATWAKTWEDEITHVIVDRELSFEDVMTYLKLKSLPVSCLAVQRPLVQLLTLLYSLAFPW